MALLIRISARLTTAIVAACLLAATILAAEQRTPTAEDDIKATFLFNFTKYIEWPAAADAREPFRLCVVAEPAFGDAVDRTISGESVDGRPIVRISPESPEAARTCQILFLGRLEDGRAARWIAAVHDAPVLIVGESKTAWERGAHINFVLDANRVKFDVNMDRAAGTGLSISSKLLRVAHQVDGRRFP